MQLLIIDDDSRFRSQLKRMVNWADYGYSSIFDAASGPEGLRKIIEGMPDLVVLDVKLPKLSGLEVIKQARSQGFGGKIVIISQYSRFEHAQRAIRYGISGYIKKPVNPDELADTLRRLRPARISAASRRFFYCIDATPPADDPDTPSFDWPACRERVYEFVISGQHEPINGMMAEAEQFLRANNVAVQKATAAILQLYCAVEGKLHELYPMIIERTDTVALLTAFGSMHTLKQMTSFICQRFHSFVKALQIGGHDSIAEKVCTYINTQYTQPLTLSVLAGAFNYNSAYLGRIFKAHTGESFNAYLERVRIEKAKELLLNVPDKIIAISEKVGFTDIDYFCKRFRWHTGETPSEYRIRKGLP